MAKMASNIRLLAYREAPYVTAVETREPRKPSYFGGTNAEAVEIRVGDEVSNPVKERNKSSSSV